MTIPDKLLHQVIKPGRYTNHEWHTVRKDWDTTRIKIALAYPDLYEIGMSNLAIPILYELMNRQADVLAERAFCPWVDMAATLKEAGIPLGSLESGRPLKDFDLVGFSLGYELNYTNVLTMLSLGGIPVLAAERGEAHPLVIAGGSAALNPEPMADFFDFFVLGDGEEVVAELLEVIRQWGKENKPGRAERLKQVAGIPGIYVPAFYRTEYLADGRLRSIDPVNDSAPAVAKRRLVNKLPPPVTRPVVPYLEVVHDRGVVEIQRGCSRGCRFCQAGMVYRPVRERPREEVLEAVDALVANCGYDEVSLLSLCTSDYPGIEKLVADIAHRHPELTVSLPSLRLDSFSVGLVSSLPARRRSGLTFAPEAGSERLRQVINKVTSEDDILATAAIAFERGWTGLKLYFMVGLPTETTEDADSIVRLVSRVQQVGQRGRRPQVRVSLATFVPKPHTPFQRVAQANEEEIIARCELIRHGLRRTGVKLAWSDPAVSLLEAALSRGDRRLGRVIYRAWQSGAVMDAWSEHFDYSRWQAAFEESGLDPAFYARRERAPDEFLPWSHIDLGIRPEYFAREYRRAQAAQPTPDCRSEACNACGFEKWLPQCRQKLGGAGSTEEY
ncbi:MAG: TIGR03960 family B12-binding radical SAM protein [Chloroflexota bacterium]